ncbi:MAG: cytochrome c biogenesis CcdA family protein [Propionibacteriaceae bacterium]|nr:cytochrome c biogenesis CcdA family protein [Propionibacteriaceae bacterium]
MGVGFAGAFLGGLAALLSPCAAMLLPSFFAYAFGSSRTRLLGRTGLFYLGLLITLVPLGLAAGSLGALLATHRSTLALVGGIILIALGLLQVLGVNFNIPGFRSGGGTGPIAVIALGAVYGLAGACTGPLLGAVLTMAAVGGSPLYGALLLAMFGAGMVVPLIVLSWVWDSASLSEKLRPRPLSIGPITTSVWGLVSGILFIVLGILFLTTDATSALGGIFDARQQLKLETALGNFAKAIPDIGALVIVAAVVGLILWQVRKPRGKDSEQITDDADAH